MHNNDAGNIHGKFHIYQFLNNCSNADQMSFLISVKAKQW